MASDGGHPTVFEAAREEKEIEKPTELTPNSTDSAYLIIME